MAAGDGSVESGIASLIRCASVFVVFSRLHDRLGIELLDQTADIITTSAQSKLQGVDT
jgi:hypothetical protein